jgi:hypothetical protein
MKSGKSDRAFFASKRRFNLRGLTPIRIANSTQFAQKYAVSATKNSCDCWVGPTDLCEVRFSHAPAIFAEKGDRLWAQAP